MKYAITYTPNGDWNNVDTVLVETPINPLDMTNVELKEMFKIIIDDEDCAELLSRDAEHWFVRNAYDTDYKLKELLEDAVDLEKRIWGDGEIYEEDKTLISNLIDLAEKQAGIKGAIK